MSVDGEPSVRSLLEEVESGGLSPEEAEARLKQMSARPDAGESTAESPQRLMRVVVESKGDNVNTRVPFPLLKWGLGLASMLPSPLLELLRSKGLDVDSLRDLGTEELQEALGALEIDFRGADGTTIRIFTE